MRSSDQYCVTCHNERLRTAELSLDTIDTIAAPAGAAVWEKVIRKLRTRAMPPAERPRPDEAAYDGVASWLETEIDRAAAVQPNPGTRDHAKYTPSHRPTSESPTTLPGLGRRIGQPRGG